MFAKQSEYLKRDESKVRDPSLHIKQLKSKAEKSLGMIKKSLSKTKTSETKSKILIPKKEEPVPKKYQWEEAQKSKKGENGDDEKIKHRLCFTNKREKEMNEKELVEVGTDEIGRFDTNIENLFYFHGFLAREEAEELLKEDGNFLIRETEYNRLNHYVISVMYKGQFHHILVKTTRTKKLYWTYKYAFKSVVELAIYHSRNGVAVYKEIVLTKGIGKQSWQINHEQIEMKKFLGDGQFGEVWRASMKTHVTKKGIVVAVKRLKDLQLSGKQKQEFLQEARTMLSLRHPNVARLYGVCTMRQPIMLVLEFCDKGALDSILTAPTKVSMPQKVTYLYHAACGLEYIHEKAVIHRDIAARNCLVTGKNVVKIADFGLSHKGAAITEKKQGSKPIKYMAPEAIKPGTYSSSSDMFSYTALIYEVLLDGKAPYGETTIPRKELVKLLATFKLKLDFNPPPDTPPYLVKIYDNCRLMDPDKRLSATQVVHILETEGTCEPFKPETFLQRMREKCRNMFREFQM